jgi:hypothetical protein
MNKYNSKENKLVSVPRHDMGCLKIYLKKFSVIQKEYYICDSCIKIMERKFKQ